MKLSDFEFKEIDSTDPLIERCAELVHKYSWGEDYLVRAITELRQNEYTIGAFNGPELIGMLCLNRVASPDNIDNGSLWLADGVVLPEYRKHKIFTFLYGKARDYFLRKNEKVFACTENPVMEKFLLDHDWTFYRETKDEEGGDCKVLIYEPIQIKV